MGFSESESPIVTAYLKLDYFFLLCKTLDFYNFILLQNRGNNFQ